MPKCRFCSYNVHLGIDQCPQCGAPVDKPSPDLEQQVRALLDQGRKIDAVKLYKERMEVSLLEAKQAVESLAARQGPMTQRAGCLGMVLTVVLVAVTLGMTMY